MDKIGWNRKNLMKSRKITISGPILRLCQNEVLKQNSPPHVQLSGAYWMFLAQSRTHATLFTSGNQFTVFNLHKSQRTKYSFQSNKSLIGNHKSSDNDLHPPQKRSVTVLTVQWLQSSLLFFPQCSWSWLPFLFIAILTATSRRRSPQQLTASGFLCNLH